MSKPLLIDESHIHAHLRQRMSQPGIDFRELELTLKEGWDAANAKPGTFGRTMVFRFDAEWEGGYYDEKEVTVYYKISRKGDFVLLTAIARYGHHFDRPRG